MNYLPLSTFNYGWDTFSEAIIVMSWSRSWLCRPCIPEAHRSVSRESPCVIRPSQPVLLLGIAMFLPTMSRAAEPCTTDLSAADILDRLINRNQVTAMTLAGYTSTRHYHLEFRGVDSLVADLTVRAAYLAPDRKEFTPESESGSTFLQRHVLQQLLMSEAEAAQPGTRERVALTPRNYNFKSVGCEQVSGRTAYVLDLTPRHANKFLIRGRIYVDNEDFAVIRVLAEPAKNPSWWTVRNEIEQTYIRVGEFWLPARNSTTTKVRLLGRAFLTIDYGEYQVMGPSRPVRNHNPVVAGDNMAWSSRPPLDPQAFFYRGKVTFCASQQLCSK